MSGIYFKFLFATTIKKKPVWITWLLFIITITMFIIVMPLAAGMNPYQVWANTTMTVCQTFLGMAVAIFTAVLAINVFKDSNEEGTELIIISKPISRKKIVFTKFVLYVVFCLMVNMCAVIISLFTIFIPGTEVEFYWGLVISMLIGNFVCFSVFGSIAVLLSSQVAKVGVIITNIIISLVFLIYQILTLFVFKTPLKSITDDKVMPLTYVYAKRDTTNGTYKEKNFVRFDASVDDDGTFAVKAKNWEEMVDYWQDTIKSKDVTPVLNITDLAGQISLTYLSIGVNKYSERQAKRMFGISRFWDYVLTYPCSPELLNVEEHLTIKPENKETLPILYCNQQYLTYDPSSSLGLYLPDQFCFVGVKETKQSSLTGSFGNQIPVGWVRGDTLLSNRDVYLEPDKWLQYKDAFDTIYDTIYRWDLKTGDNLDYYDNTELESRISRGEDDYSSYSYLWDYNALNLKKYYELVWAMLTGHSDEDQYLGENTPMTEEMNNSLEINDSVDELNNRFTQYKYYAYYRAYDEQQQYLRQTSSAAEATAKNEALINPIWLALYALDTIPVEENWYMQGVETGMVIPDIGDYSLIENNTIVPNVELMILTKDQLAIDLAGQPTLKDELINSTFGRYKRTSRIFNDSITPIEHYLFVSTEAPTRKSSFTGETYSERPHWTPYIVNDILVKSGADPIPIGQNMNYFFFEARQTLDFWIYAVIWIAISLGLFGAGIIVYNKYDVK